MLNRYQRVFFDSSLKHPSIKLAISSPYEFTFKKILDSIGEEGKDWFHQAPFCDEDNSLIAVADFAFPKEKVIIELDGANHARNNQHAIDKKRDTVFRSNDYLVIRIPAPVEGDDRVYWKVFIQQTLKSIRKEQSKKSSKKRIKKLVNSNLLESEIVRRLSV